MKSAVQGMKKLRIDFERMLVPANAYFSILMRINDTKQLNMEEPIDPDSIVKIRKQFRELIDNGSILEYKNDLWWYDVHPLIREIEGFKNVT